MNYTKLATASVSVVMKVFQNDVHFDERDSDRTDRQDTTTFAIGDHLRVHKFGPFTLIAISNINISKLNTIFNHSPVSHALIWLVIDDDFGTNSGIRSRCLPEIGGM